MQASWAENLIPSNVEGGTSSITSPDPLHPNPPHPDRLHPDRCHRRQRGRDGKSGHHSTTLGSSPLLITVQCLWAWSPLFDRIADPDRGERRDWEQESVSRCRINSHLSWVAESHLQISTRLPLGRKRKTSMTSSFLRRMQPCEAGVPISHSCGVPWR